MMHQQMAAFFAATRGNVDEFVMGSNEISVEAGEPPTPEEFKLLDVKRELETAGGNMLFFERIIAETDTVASITRASVLAKKHLCLPPVTFHLAQAKCDECMTMVYSWPGGLTSCGNAMWDYYLLPILADAKQATRKKLWRDAFAQLLTILLIGTNENTWIHGLELGVAYCDWDAFRSWFTRLSFAWNTILQQSDEDIGLLNPHGKPDGYYRGVLMLALKNWAAEVNGWLDSELNPLRDKPARLVIPRS